MIDSHCHINDKAFENYESMYIKEASANGVNTFLVVGYDLDSSKKAIEISEGFECCFAAIGIHPSDSKRFELNVLEKIDLLAKNNRAVAVGEIGLDYYWDKEENIKNKQKEFFIKQIEIANKHDLPISIHCHDAYEDCLNILKLHPVKKGGIMHCYGGSKEMIGEFIKLGFLIGIGGVVTFKNAVKMKEVAAAVPSNKYVLETDSPYLAPTPFRGQQNHSKYLYLVRDEIAKLRNCSPETIEEETNKNFKNLFKL